MVKSEDIDFMLIEALVLSCVLRCLLVHYTNRFPSSCVVLDVIYETHDLIVSELLRSANLMPALLLEIGMLA